MNASTAVFDMVAAAVPALMQSFRVPGVAVGVVGPDGKLRVANFGVTNIDHALPVTPTTVFQVGSISKVFTACAVARLGEQGHLDLDRPVCTWLPDLRLADPEASARVTLRHLLQHAGGFFGDYEIDTGRGDDALARVRPVIEAARQATPVGAYYHYCNLGYVLIGQVIEAVSQETFEAAINRLVIAPLGLHTTALFPENLIFERLAAGHTVTSTDVGLSDYGRPRARVPNGGVLSCVADLATFARMHLNGGRTDDGDEVLTTDSVHAMQQPGVSVGGDDEYRGLGWSVSHRYGLRIVEHAGSTPGFQTGMWVVPDSGIALIVLTNASSGGDLVRRAGRLLQTCLYGDPLPHANGAVAEAELDGLRGLYMGAGLIEIGGTAAAPLVTTRMGALNDPAQHAFAATTTADRYEITAGQLEGLQFDVLRARDLRRSGARDLRRSGALHDNGGSDIEFLRLGGRLFRRVSHRRHVERVRQQALAIYPDLAEQLDVLAANLPVEAT